MVHITALLYGTVEELRQLKEDMLKYLDNEPKKRKGGQIRKVEIWDICFRNEFKDKFLHHYQILHKPSYFWSIKKLLPEIINTMIELTGHKPIDLPEIEKQKPELPRLIFIGERDDINY